MAKKRKTLKDKQRADIRRQRPQNTSSISLSDIASNGLNSSSVPVRDEKKSMYTFKATPTPTISTLNYQFLKSDLVKTAIVTSSIVIVQLILYYFIHKV